MALMEAALRNQICKIAMNELGKVFAKRSGAIDSSVVPPRNTRLGFDRLVTYFRIAAPNPRNPTKSLYPESDVTYLPKGGGLAPMPDWCGIFALWAIKVAGCQVGTWVPGSGISSVRGFKTVKTPKMGDIGYDPQPKQHHFLVVKVYEKGGSRFLETIEGNSGISSEVNHYEARPLMAKLKFYSCFLRLP
jgi:hypothetical protein